METDPNSQESQADTLRMLSKAKPFLGREFLTWLWHRTEVESSGLSIETSYGTQQINELWIDDRLVLEASQGNGHYHLLKGGDPSRSAEAAAALRSGKQVRELKMGLELEGRGRFTFTLSFDDLAPRSIQFPRASTDEDEQDDSSESEKRLVMTMIVLDCLNGLFELFLKDRLGDSWDKEITTAIKTWIHGRSKDMDPNYSLH